MSRASMAADSRCIEAGTRVVKVGAVVGAG